MDVGFIGLGNMGTGLSLNLKDHGHRVVAWNRTPEKRESAKAQGLEVVDSVAQMAEVLPSPRVIWCMISAGSAIEGLLFDQGGLAEHLAPGDIIIESANSHFLDSERRAALLAERGIHFLDCGVSGGVDGARRGANIMVGGDESVFHQVEELFRDTTQPGGYGYFGKSGNGHYVKMVHNAIEYGMMQALAEGANLLQVTDRGVDLVKLTEVWNNGSIIQSNLVGFLHQALVEDPGLQTAASEIGALGTGQWAVAEALKEGVPFTAIAHSVFQRFNSQGRGAFAAKIVSSLRYIFGRHSPTDRPPQ